jgi:predicted DsbA family dithiol-disulfide isomerase
MLASDDYGQAVEDDEQTAKSFGVNGVPFFVIDRRYAVSGAQPPEIMTQVLDRVWAEAEGTSTD